MTEQASWDRLSQLFKDQDEIALDHQVRLDPKRVANRDLVIYGITGLLGVAGMVKNFAEWATPGGGSAATAVSNAGDLEFAALAGLAVYTKMTGRRVSGPDVGGARDLGKGKVDTPDLLWSQFLVMYPTVLLSFMALCEVAEALDGFGRPDRGSAFTAGAATLASVCRIADPDPSRWAGAGAANYAQRNADRQKLAETLAELDRRMVQLVSLQADDVEMLRQGFAGTKVAMASIAGIIAAFIPAALADESGVVQLRLQRIFVLLAGSTLGTLFGLGVTGIVRGVRNGSAADKVRIGYQDLAAAADARAEPRAAEPASVPGAAAPAAVGTRATGGASGPAPKPAPAAGAVQTAPDPAYAAASTAESAIDDSPPSTVGMAMRTGPAVAQGMQLGPQFAQMAGQAGGRSKDRAVAPAADTEPEQDATNEAGVGPAASAGTAGTGSVAGRAPVDVAVSADEQPPGAAALNGDR